MGIAIQLCLQPSLQLIILEVEGEDQTFAKKVAHTGLAIGGELNNFVQKFHCSVLNDPDATKASSLAPATRNDAHAIGCSAGGTHLRMRKPELHDAFLGGLQLLDGKRIVAGRLG